VVSGQDGQGAEYVHLNQSPGGIEQAAGEHDVPDDLSVGVGNQRETIGRRDGLPQGIDQVGHDKAMVPPERPPVDILHRLSVIRKFFPRIHVRDGKDSFRWLANGFWDRNGAR
jgi:hypothetical protein